MVGQAGHARGRRPDCQAGELAIGLQAKRSALAAGRGEAISCNGLTWCWALHVHTTPREEDFLSLVVFCSHEILAQGSCFSS
jgi:hypothetical protein